MARNLRLRLAAATAALLVALCASAQGPRVGVALGSGSSHGLAHVGAIQELEARGLEVEVVAGTSVGALFGALWASGLSGADIERIARDAQWLHGARLAFSWQGLYSNDPLHDELERLFRGRPIEEWPKRFGAVATNLSNGHRRLLTSGPGALAVRASSAVPGYFKPVLVNGEKLADGALVEPVPAEAARALGADFVIAIDVAYRPYEENVDSAAQYAFQAMHILVNALAERQLPAADVALRLDVHRTLVSEGREAVLAEGREAVRRAWPQIESALARAAKRHANR